MNIRTLLRPAKTCSIFGKARWYIRACSGWIWPCLSVWLGPSVTLSPSGCWQPQRPRKMDRLFGQHMSSQTDANAFVVRHPEIHLVPHDYLLQCRPQKWCCFQQKKKRRSPGILLGFFFLPLCFIFCNWHDSGRPHVISSWTDWDAHSLKTYMYYIFHCLIVSENLLYGTMNRNFPIIWRDWRAKNQSQLLIDLNPSFMRDWAL